jgi:hypothetical protein
VRYRKVDFAMVAVWRALADRRPEPICFDPQLDPQHCARHALNAQNTIKNPAKRYVWRGMRAVHKVRSMLAQ